MAARGVCLVVGSGRGLHYLRLSPKIGSRLVILYYFSRLALSLPSVKIGCASGIHLNLFFLRKSLLILAE